MPNIYFYIIITLLCLILIYMFISNAWKNKRNEMIKKEQLNEVKIELLKLFNETNIKGQSEIVKSIDSKFDFINKNVSETITKSFKKTDETFVNVVERLTKIDEQNKNITKLSTEVLSLNNILTDKLTRGTFGEVQLYKLLEAVYGNNNLLYETQKKLPNGTIPDAIVHAPKPLGSIVIDSKFPLENYKRYMDPNISKEEKRRYKNIFNTDLKKHIKDISNKYIVGGYTANQAIMFIPAESIYLEVVSNHYEVINYAYENNVWITSPTTLISSLTVIEAVSNSVRQTEQTDLLIKELKYLANEFRKFKERSDNVSKRILKLKEDMDDLNITNNYIYNKFKEIEEGKLD